MIGLLRPLDIPVQLGRDEARDRALAELAKAKYGGTPEWVDRTTRRASELGDRLITWFLRLFFDRPAGGGGVHWPFLIAVVLLLVALGLVIWRVGLPRWSRRRRSAALELDPTRAAADYRSLAEAAAERGDWAGAVREGFRAVVRELEIRTILDVRPARTAWEAAHSASRSLPECEPALRAAADTFNAVVYGDRTATATEYAQVVALDAQVREAADRADLSDAEPEPVPAR